jgi:hypothetical protein
LINIFGTSEKFPLYTNHNMRIKGAGLHDLVGRIEGALNHKIFALGTFLGIEGAFDNDSFNSIVMASLEHGVDGTSTKWIDPMLKNRTDDVVILINEKILSAIFEVTFCI